jgi:hypothetical protein
MENELDYESTSSEEEELLDTSEYGIDYYNDTINDTFHELVQYTENNNLPWLNLPSAYPSFVDLVSPCYQPAYTPPPEEDEEQEI